jgi:hypothetical protein
MIGKKERLAKKRWRQIHRKVNPIQDLMQSVGGHQEVPKEEAAVMPVGGLRKRRRDRNMGAGAQPEAEGKDPGKLWIQEEIHHRRQEDDPSCNSDMEQEKCLQKNWDPGNMWTAEETDRGRNEDDPPCKSGMA